MARWSFFLMAYNYKLVHQLGKSIINADALRCPLSELVVDLGPITLVLLIDIVTVSPDTSNEIGKYTKKDKTLSRVLNWVLRGWP